MILSGEGGVMKRTQIQLDEQTYEAVRRRAFEQHRSISSVVREVLGQAFGSPPHRRLSLRDFTLVAAGRSRQGHLKPVSERHDEALTEALVRDLQR
jgi:plasmid stability protein